MQSLVLGTAQFGAGYGITNARGRLSDAEVAGILASASNYGIHALDTASGYGDAQARLRPWAKGYAITTKVPGSEPTRIQGRVEAALAELGLPRVDSVLLHDWHDLAPAEQQAAARALADVRRAGLAAAVGISGYGEDDLRSAHEVFDHLDIVQIPVSAIDRRLDGSPTVSTLRGEGTRIQVRSVFLQGLLAAPSTTPLGQHPAVQAFHADCERRGVAPMVAALAHIRALGWVDEVVIGVTSADELGQVRRSWDSGPALLADDELACDDLSLIDPRSWSRQPPSGTLPS